MNINYYCTLTNTGFGNSSFGYIQGLINLGHRVQVFPVCPKCSLNFNTWATKEQQEYLIPRFEEEPDVSFIHINPDFFKKMRNDPKFTPYKKGKYKTISFGTFETFEPPYEWFKELNEECTDVICPSNFTKTVFECDDMCRPISVIPHVVHDDFFNIIPKHTNKKDFVILSVATWTQRKNWENLIRGCVLAMNAGCEFRLLMKVTSLPGVQKITENQIIKTLETLVPKKFKDKFVYIAHDMTTTDMVGLYSYSDAFLCASRGEGFGIPVAEAMASGVPIVSTRSGSLHDLVDEENATIIAHNGFEKKSLDNHKQFNEKDWPIITEELIGNAIIKMMSTDTSIIEKKKVNAKKKATKEYSLLSVTNQLKELLTF